MSDPIAEAAAHIADAAPSSTEPQQSAPEVAQLGEQPTAEAAVAASAVPSTTQPISPAVELAPKDGTAELPNAAATPPAGAATPAATGNVLLNGAPVVDAPVIDAPAVEAEPEPLPRESHLMLLEAKFAAALAKLRNAERVSVDELESIYTHIQAVI